VLAVGFGFGAWGAFSFVHVVAGVAGCAVVVYVAAGAGWVCAAEMVN